MCLSLFVFMPGKLGKSEGLLLSVVSSAVSAAVMNAIRGPFTRIKIILQTQEELVRTGRLLVPFSGILDCFRFVVAEEGYAGLWRGVLYSVLSVVPTQILNFLLRDRIRKTFKTSPEDSYGKCLAYNTLSGVVVDSVGLLASYPFDVVRVKLAADIANSSLGIARQYSGYMNCLKQIVANEGITGLYKGYCVSIAGIAVYRFTYFAFYDLFASLDLGKDSVFIKFIIGYTTTVLANVCSYPMDTIHKRMIVASGPFRYASTFHAARTIGVHAYSSFFNVSGLNLLSGMICSGLFTLFSILRPQ